MQFEYDPKKSNSNRDKHGMDFEEAKNLWLDEDRLQVQAKSDTETRFTLIAKYQAKLWAAFFTMREDRIRIISVRRARDQEKELYYES